MEVDVIFNQQDFPDLNHQIFGCRRRQPNAQPRRINHQAIYGNNYRGGRYNQATRCWVALDAQTRGLKTALIELDDFSSKTSVCGFVNFFVNVCLDLVTHFLTIFFSNPSTW
ncbi:unnamed protein product [Meloidogyne enterolobii]|uniref:Uncharacterized protein n=1 Tax=Meloidogyne enterolobii TaxID=390850 RepID=A0ACB0ZBU0_MELEN